MTYLCGTQCPIVLNLTKSTLWNVIETCLREQLGTFMKNETILWLVYKYICLYVKWNEWMVKDPIAFWSNTAEWVNIYYVIVWGFFCFFTYIRESCFFKIYIYLFLIVSSSFFFFFVKCMKFWILSIVYQGKKYWNK